jgi:hypothetical protein
MRHTAGTTQAVVRHEARMCGLLCKYLAERTGLEPATPGVTGRYSNQLNYRSNWWVLRGSNPRHSPCKGDALPAELSTPTERAR